MRALPWMMPFFPLYGVLTHQVFAHTYMGSQRHAFTVGFISMMILGVSSRVVPILAGLGTEKGFRLKELKRLASAVQLRPWPPHS